MIPEEHGNQFDFIGDPVYTGVNARTGVLAPMTMPCLRVSEIPAEGTRLECQVRADALGLDQADVDARGEFSVQADILALGEEVTVRGTLSGSVLRQCVRCLRAYEDPCKVPFAVQYRVRQGPPTRPARRPGSTGQEHPPEHPVEVAALMEVESYSYTGDWVDLAPMLREQMILAIPVQPLCREDCQGLCPRCGQERNRRARGCSEEQLPSPFRVLRVQGQHRGSSSGTP